MQLKSITLELLSIAPISTLWNHIEQSKAFLDQIYFNSSDIHMNFSQI